MIDTETADVIATALLESIPEMWDLDRLDELCLFVASTSSDDWDIEEIGLYEDAPHGVNTQEEMDNA